MVMRKGESKARGNYVRGDELRAEEKGGGVDRELVANYKAQGFISLHWVFLSHSAEPPPKSCPARFRFREHLHTAAGQIVQLIIQIVDPL